MSKLKWFSSRLAVVCAQSTEVDNEDVVGAAPTGDAPTTSELSTILLQTKVRLILETWRRSFSLRRNYSPILQRQRVSYNEIVAWVSVLHPIVKMGIISINECPVMFSQQVMAGCHQASGHYRN